MEKWSIVIKTPSVSEKAVAGALIDWCVGENDRSLKNGRRYEWDDLRYREPQIEPQVVFHGQRWQDMLRIATAWGSFTIFPIY